MFIFTCFIYFKILETQINISNFSNVYNSLKMEHTYLDNMKKAAAIRKHNEIQNGGNIIHNLEYPKFYPDSTVDELISYLKLWIDSNAFATTGGEIKCNIIKNCVSKVNESTVKLQATELRITHRDNPFLKPDCLFAIAVKFYYGCENNVLYDIAAEVDFMDNTHSECYKKISLIDYMILINKVDSPKIAFTDIAELNDYACHIENLIDCINFKEMYRQNKLSEIIKNQWDNLLYVLKAMLGKKFNDMIGSVPQIMLDNYSGTIGEFYARLMSFYLPANLRDSQLAFIEQDKIEGMNLSDIHIKQKRFITSVKEGMKRFSDCFF